VSDFKVAVCTGTLCVNNTFGNALAVKVGKLVYKVVVLEEYGTIRASSE